MLAGAMPVAAADLNLEGVWGNSGGCAFTKGGATSDDSRMVLRPGGVETYAALCEWVSVATARDGTQVVTGLCDHEGEVGRSVDTYIVEKDPWDAGLIRIRAYNGEVWGEVRRCP